MQSNELSAVLAKTDEVALYPAPVCNELPRTMNQRVRGGALYCPSGMKRARVVKNGVQWIERRVVSACGDQEYEVKRKNGVLVELDIKDVPHKKGVRVRDLPHTKTLFAGRVQMVVSRRAIVSAWGEYELLEAQREKEREEERQRVERLRAALRGLAAEDRFDSSGYYRRWDRDGKKHLEGKVSLTLEQAERIAAVLTPRQREKLAAA